MSAQDENLFASSTKLDPIWGVVANIVDERPYGHAGREIRHGTPKFNAGEKVYLWDVYWGMGGIISTVIGRFRGKYDYLTFSVQTAYLTHFRSKLIYSPT